MFWSLRAALSTYLWLQPVPGSALKVKTSTARALLGGLAAPLALALSLGPAHHTPLTRRRSDRGLRRVADSVIVQGLSITPLMRALGEIVPASATNLGRPS